MSRNLNRWQGIGNVGRDIESTFSSGGVQIANFSIACGDDYKDKQGQKVEQTEWVNCVAFGKSAEVLCQYAGKGSKLYVEGKFTTQEYTGSDGIKRWSTKIKVSDFEFLTPKGDSQPRPQGSAIPQNAQKAQGAPANDFNADEFSDSIPF